MTIPKSMYNNYIRLCLSDIEKNVCIVRRNVWEQNRRLVENRPPMSAIILTHSFFYSVCHCLSAVSFPIWETVWAHCLITQLKSIYKPIQMSQTACTNLRPKLKFFAENGNIQMSWKNMIEMSVFIQDIDIDEQFSLDIRVFHHNRNKCKALQWHDIKAECVIIGVLGQCTKWSTVCIISCYFPVNRIFDAIDYNNSVEAVL